MILVNQEAFSFLIAFTYLGQKIFSSLKSGVHNVSIITSLKILHKRNLSQ